MRGDGYDYSPRRLKAAHEVMPGDNIHHSTRLPGDYESCPTCGDDLRDENHQGYQCEPFAPKPVKINPYVGQYWSPETLEEKAWHKRRALAAKLGVTLVKDAYGDIWATRVGCPCVRIGD